MGVIDMFVMVTLQHRCSRATTSLGGMSTIHFGCPGSCCSLWLSGIECLPNSQNVRVVKGELLLELDSPQERFNLIKSSYPHYHAGKGKKGHVIFWERPGELNMKEIKKQGITTEDMLNHWIFL